MNVFKRIYLPLLLVVVLVFGSVGWILLRGELTRLEEEQLGVLALAREIFTSALVVPLNQIRGMSHEPDINRAVRLPTGEARASMESHLATLLYRNPMYDQVRWINADGSEAMRVRKTAEGPQVVPEKDLVQMGQRYWFRGMVSQPPGGIYMSALDLHQDNGVPVVPERPVVRFGIRLPNEGGRDLGVLVINLLAGDLLEKLRSIKRLTPGEEVLLLNKNGYWLLSPHPEDVFSFDRGHPEHSFANRYPERWAGISTEPKGQLLRSDGLWTWTTIDMSEIFGAGLQQAESWKLVTRVPAETVAAMLWKLLWPVILLGLLTFAAAVVTVGRFRKMWSQREAWEMRVALSMERVDAERRLRLATDGAGLGIWTLDTATGHLVLSERCKEHLGLPLEEEPTMDAFYALVNPEDRAEVERAVGDSIATGRDYRAEYRVRHRDGKELWISALGRVHKGADGVIQSLSGVTMDVSQRHRAEEALRRLNSELEGKVKERTAQLEDALAAKGLFLANMSHEIRTPMNAVVGLSHLLRNTPLDGTQREYVEKIYLSGTALLGVLNDILDFSKVEAGELQLEDERIDIAELFRKCGALFGFQAETKGVRLVLPAAPDVPANLRGDSLRLLQVVNNLISNALKFTEHGEVRVTVNVESETEDDVMLKFTVTDTGIGIPPEQAERLFAPFQQADHSTTRKYGGTGLGLSIARSLSELMGGNIGVDSVPGQGSSFWFTARFLKGEPASGSSQPASSSLNHSGRVLVVDDNATNLLVSRQQLRRLGMTVETADSGPEAVEKAAKGDYDIIFMDLQMPDMDGHEATRRIREAEQAAGRAPVPIIALSAAAMKRDVELSIAAGMNGHLAKPIQKVQLAATLSKWLPGDRTSGSAQEAGSA